MVKLSAPENKFWEHPAAQLAIIFIAVFLSRLPFLSAGYGMDNDGWRLAAAARNISVSGEYGYSRVPGHPVQEIICTFFWREGPVFLNGLTAVMSSLAAVFFALILGNLGSKKIYLPVFAFAFTPIIFINSTNSMDHMWALAFMLGSIYFVMSNKPVAGGIFLGIAAGCRLTSELLLIPLIIILYYGKSPKQNILKLTLSTMLVSFILFIPAYLRYELDFFKGFENAFAGIIYIIFRLTVTLWGFIGVTAILTALLIQVYRYKIKHVRQNGPFYTEKYYNVSLITGVLLFVLAFSLSPHKAGYLIPIVPLILILLGRILDTGLFKMVCMSLIISPFLLSVNRLDLYFVPDFSRYSYKLDMPGSPIVFDFLKGPIISDHSKRIKQVEYANEIIAAGKGITGNSVVVAGESYPLVDVTLPYNVQGKVIYEYLLDSMKVKEYINKGYDIYYLPDEEKTNLSVYNINLKDYGGKPFIIK